MTSELRQRELRRLRNLPKSTQLASSRAQTQTRGQQAPRPARVDSASVQQARPLEPPNLVLDGALYNRGAWAGGFTVLVNRSPPAASQQLRQSMIVSNGITGPRVRAEARNHPPPTLGLVALGFHGL